MPVYDYKGLTPAGAAKTGIIDADSPREARIKLRSDAGDIAIETRGSAAILVAF